MKITVKAVLVFVLLAGGLSAAGLMQHGGRQDPQYYKYMVFRMTEELELTDAQAEKFFPLHRRYQDAKHQCHLDMAALSEAAYEREDIGEEDLRHYREEIRRLHQEERELDSDFYDELENFLSAEQVVRFLFFEHHFRREMYRELKKRYGGPEEDSDKRKGLWPGNRK